MPAARLDHPRGDAQHAVEEGVHSEWHQQLTHQPHDPLVVGVQPAPVPLDRQEQSGDDQFHRQDERKRRPGRKLRVRRPPRAELVSAPRAHGDGEAHGYHERQRVGHLEDGHGSHVVLRVGE